MKTKQLEFIPKIATTDVSAEIPNAQFFEKKRQSAIEFLKMHPIPEVIWKRIKKEN